LSQFLSSIGDNFYDMAVVWIATREAGADAGLVVLAGSVAAMLLGIPGGILVDRFNRRVLMALVDTTRMVVLLLLTLLAFTSEVQLWHLAIVTAINVGLNGLFQPAIIATVGTISTTSEDKQAINALMDVTARLARAVAPAFVGILLATILPAYLFFLDALTFGLSALAIFSLARTYAWQPQSQDTDRQRTVKSEILQGGRAIWGHPVMRWLMPMKLITNYVWGLAFVIGIPLLVETQFTGDPRLYGNIVAAYGVGNVLGNIVLGNLRIERRAFVMFGGLVILGIGFIVMGSASTPLIAMLGAFFASFGGPMDDIMMLLYVQEDFPSHTIGKVYSVRIVLSEIGYALGVGSAPLLYPLLGTPTTIVFAGVLMLTGGLVGWAKFGLQRYTPHLRGEV
jgi:DHA3 family macrolide efflux protein-like MFS transporter